MNNAKSITLLPYWCRILIHFESQRYFHNGLTIPFIIGSRQYIELGESLHSVEELLTAFSESSYYFNVLMCDQFGDFMFRITDYSEYGYHSKVGNFIIQDDSFAGARTISDIIPQLTRRYADNLLAGRYSREPGNWIEFTVRDVSRIKEVADL